METFNSPKAEDHLRAGHDVQAQWTQWYTHKTTLTDDGLILVDTATADALDDGDGDTELYCRDCLMAVDPGDGYQIDYV